MNRRGRSGVILAIIWTVLFLPELGFFLLSWLNYRLWDRLLPRKIRPNIREHRLRNRSLVWTLREQESLTEHYTTILGGIMPIKTKTKLDTYRHVPSSEKDIPEGEQTVFILRDLKHSEATAVGDYLAGFGDDGEFDRLKAGTFQLKMVCARLAGWENLFDENGEKVSFPTQRKEVERIMDEVANAAPEILTELVKIYGSQTGKGQL